MSIKILIDKSHLEQLKDLPSEYDDQNVLFFYADSNILDFELKEYDIVMLCNPCAYSPDDNGFTGKITDEEKKEIRKFAKNGGFLILTTGFPIEDNKNRQDTLEFFSEMLELEKIIDGMLFSTDEKGYKGTKKNIICKSSTEEFFKDIKYVLSYEGNLFIPTKKSNVILNGPKNSSFKTEGKIFKNIQKPPIAVLNKYGKGKVLGISSTAMFMPITKNNTVPTHNRQYLMNIFNSLTEKKEKKELEKM